MFKKSILIISILFCALTLRAQDRSSLLWRENITMLVVPREPQTVQVALDMARYSPALVVCYQPRINTPALHAWNGEGWVAVSIEEYVNGLFFTTPPQHAILVEKQGAPAPDCLIPDGTWCKKGNRLTTTDRRAMIHLLGLHFDLPYRYWLQLTRRYGYSLEKINPSLENISWLQHRGTEKDPVLFNADIHYWNPLEIKPPLPVEPVDLKTPELIKPAETPSLEQEPEPVEPKQEPETPSANIQEPTEPASVGEIILQLDPTIDPFSTNDVPEAELITIPAE